ncbi:MAG: amylo-alpha-1,6-glucosidase [Rhodospirillaceae bacterium]|nr:amylo-alpha-1,6-glucosidase [Rhodospirillaceae bacterium]
MNESAAADELDKPWEETAESPFHIAARDSLEDRRTLKHGDTFALFDVRGDIRLTPEGLYHEDTRYLSRFVLQLNGQRPLLLSSTVRDDNSVLSIDLTNPDLFADGRLVLARESIHIHRARFLWEGALHERIGVRNYDQRDHVLTLHIGFGADFADLFEVRGQRRPRRGTVSLLRVSESAVALRYRGLDNVVRELMIRFDPEPTTLDTRTATFRFAMPAQRRETLIIQASCGRPAEAWSGRVFLSRMQRAVRALRRASGRAASIESSNSLYNEVIRRAVSDLYMLITDTDHGPYPYAGIPWFSTAFGRDAIVTALFSLWLDPEIARGVLRFLAATQAREVDLLRDAEPGKILHEKRSGEMARLREVPFGLYYGSVDATPLFLMLAGAYLERTGDVSTIEAIWPGIEAALVWVDGYGDMDGDGFVEYGRKNADGLINQGWKDSADAVFHADGRLAEGPIALCEVQGYVYAARRAAARLAAALGRHALAGEQERRAEVLRERFEAAFWCEELGVYALALDGAKQACRVVTSNAGHALFTGIAAPQRARAVADTLLGPACFSGWGIRTVAQSERRYNPMSYHDGSVWPHDNALIALGLARYGFKEATARVFKALFEAATYMDLRRLPELFCGFSRKQRSAPTAYPVACSPQAWASAAPLALLQASLGLSFDHAAGELRLDRPVLPDFIDELQLRRLRLGESSADILIRRYRHDVAVNVLRREGRMRIVVRH